MSVFARRCSARPALFVWLAVAAAATPAAAKERSVEIWVGETTSISAGRKQVERDTVTAVSDDEKIAKAEWGGGDNGPVLITGVAKGDAVVTVNGKVRVVSLGLGGGSRRDANLSSEAFTEYIKVKVLDSEIQKKKVVLLKRQSMTIDLGKGAKIRSIANSNKAKVRVHKNTLSKLTITGKKVGKSLVTVKFTRTEKGKEKRITGLIDVTVIKGKGYIPKSEPRVIKKGWDAVPKKVGFLPGTRPRLLPDWPGMDGVLCAFIPSGKNYGDIGDLIIKNTGDKPVTVTIPPGMLLSSLDPGVQDLYNADVSTEKPCAGADKIGKPITVQPGETVVVRHLPGFCPDFEKKPPKKEDTTVYVCKKPDKKSKVLLATIASAKKMDVGELKLEVFAEAKARAMITQGALWMVDSRIDDVEGNEVTPKALSDKFVGSFNRAAKEALDKMTPEDRKQAEKLVKDDVTKLVQATDFLTKPFAKSETPPEDV